MDIDPDNESIQPELGAMDSQNQDFRCSSPTREVSEPERPISFEISEDDLDNHPNNEVIEMDISEILAVENEEGACCSKDQGSPDEPAILKDFKTLYSPEAINGHTPLHAKKRKRSDKKDLDFFELLLSCSEDESELEAVKHKKAVGNLEENSFEVKVSYFNESDEMKEHSGALAENTAGMYETSAFEQKLLAKLHQCDTKKEIAEAHNSEVPFESSGKDSFTSKHSTFHDVNDNEEKPADDTATGEQEQGECYSSFKEEEEFVSSDSEHEDFDDSDGDPTYSPSAEKGSDSTRRKNLLNTDTEPQARRGSKKKSKKSARTWNTRKSGRLRCISPTFSGQELEGVDGNSHYGRRGKENSDLLSTSFQDLEAIVYKPSGSGRKRKSTSQATCNKYLIPADQVTKKMLSKVCKKVNKKVYSSTAGTTCHQCRQKTLDQKTSCRNPHCSGFHGMFCSICLRNRYGEDIVTALLDPKWICPVCRGRCNCSICRKRKGKRPTGILAPLASESGFSSVDAFLQNLDGQREKPELDDYWTLKKEPDELLGLSNGNAQLREGHVEMMNYQEAEDAEDNSAATAPISSDEALLGFSEEGRNAHFQDGHVAIMSCKLCQDKELAS